MRNSLSLKPLKLCNRLRLNKRKGGLKSFTMKRSDTSLKPLKFCNKLRLNKRKVGYSKRKVGPKSDTMKRRRRRR